MPVDFAKIIGDAKPYVDVPCESWELDGETPDTCVRLARLRGADKLRLTVQADALEKDDEGRPVDQAEAWEFAVGVLAASIVDGEGSLQFSVPDRMAWLDGEIGAVSELLPVALELNGLGSKDTDAEQVEQKKSDSETATD